MLLRRGFMPVGQPVTANIHGSFGGKMDQGNGRDDVDAKVAREAASADKGATPKGPPPGHTLEDHAMGDISFHDHGPDADHDHDDDFDDVPLDENPLWIADNVRLTSVGIDVGSSGTQVIFSRLHLRRMAEDMSSRYFVVNRETLFQSPVSL